MHNTLSSGAYKIHNQIYDMLAIYASNAKIDSWRNSHAWTDSWELVVEKGNKMLICFFPRTPAFNHEINMKINRNRNVICMFHNISESWNFAGMFMTLNEKYTIKKNKSLLGLQVFLTTQDWPRT